jgi:predicted transposase YdaD
MMNEAEAINELREAKLKAERGGRRHLPLAIRDARQAGMSEAQIADELDMSIELVAATVPVE